MQDKTNYSKDLESAKDVSEIFRLVRRIVKDILGKERAGLMLGLAELGGQPGAFIGAFYPVSSNAIVLNKTPMRIVEHMKPELYKHYLFHLLLHEYLHSIGILDEDYNRAVTLEISEKAFGKDHPAVVIAKDFNKLFPEVIYASMGWRPAKKLKIEFVEGFDADSTRYIG